MLGAPAQRRSWTAAATALALVFALALLVSPLAAQEPGSLAARQEASRTELDRVMRDITLSQERLDGIAKEIDGLRNDQRALTAEMIQAAMTERKLSQEAAAIGERMAGLAEQQTLLRESLSERRSVLAEVLAALQRMGLNPPPAILVRPEDALASVRSAILLGAVVPELRAETELLLGDLKELNRLADTIAAERGRLLATVEEQLAEQERLQLLLGEKATLQARSQEVLDAEQARAQELAGTAQSLQELIEGLEAEMLATRLAEEEALREAEAERLAAIERENRQLPETSRMAEPVPFGQMVGKTMPPVAGSLAQRFGQEDDTGARLSGDIVTTQSGAIVTAPADGTVIYAGPFRSYGQLLILNAGGGYHLVLAGLGRIGVSPGQSVLAGEPVGAMGEARLVSAVSFGSENTGPQLYVELRKDGTPVDPARWWAEPYSGRTGNDT